MALVFNAPDTQVYSSLAAGFNASNSTSFILMKRSADSGGSIRYAAGFSNNVGTALCGFGFDATDHLLHHNGTTSVASPTMTITVADGWVMFGYTKVTGTTTPRFHKHVFSTGVTTHENASGTIANASNMAATGRVSIARYPSGGATTGVGSYALLCVAKGAVLSDEEVSSACASLGAMASLCAPSGANTSGLWLFDGEVTGANELFLGSTLQSGSASAVESEGAPFGYGGPVFITDNDPSPAGGFGTVTFTGGGVLSITGSGSIAPPDPSPPQPVGTGWTMLSVTPDGVTTDVKFTDTGNFTHDQSRPIRRAISGFTLLPTEAAKLDLVRDSIHAYLRVDDQSYPMGIFYFTESSRQKDAIIGPDGNPADLIHVSLSDQFIRLQRSDEVPRIALAGADPSQEMIKYIGETEVPHSITGADNPIADDVLWQPFTPYETIVTQLAELAGHRRPWADNYGVIRSVAARVVDSDVIPLEELDPIAGTIIITENYLSAPNRVVVYDDSAMYPIVGAWDAPSSAPNNATTRGWVTTTGVQAQGLSGPIHAQQVAETLGEQFSSRRLSCDIVPTNRLDGPVVLSYDGALWLVDSWAVSTKVGSTMSFDATELILSPSEES